LGLPGTVEAGIAGRTWMKAFSGHSELDDVRIEALFGISEVLMALLSSTERKISSMKCPHLTILFCMTVAAAAAQSPAAGPAFEVASIRASPPIDTSSGPLSFGPRGGPGTEDPTRYTCNFCNISELVSQAYNLPEYRVFSAKRLPTDRFHIVANVPAGATRDRFQVMLQNLLADRFGLRIHRELREMEMFRLLRSPGVLKLKPHIEGASVEARADKADKREHAPGYYYRVQAKSMADFANVIEGRIQKPVADATGLTGTYDFDVWWAFDDLSADSNSAPNSPTMLSVIQSLGLRLDSQKGQVEVVVIDDAKRSPTEN